MEPTAFIVDDHAAVRDALLTLLDSVGIQARGFDDGNRLLSELDPACAGCVLLDVRMPHTGGLTLARRLRQQGSLLPIVFISAHGDVRIVVEAMRLGAQDFIEKPFRDQEVIDSVQRCFKLNGLERERSRKQLELTAGLAALSARERLVLERVVRGESNKEIAIGLNLSCRTIETHRAHVMKKMQTSTLAALVARITWLETWELCNPYRGKGSGLGSPT